jgi:hydroxymethylglutaryl-CoA lyase
MAARAYNGDSVRIVEVGARDGLQNQARVLDVTVRVGLIERLEQAGLREIEVGSFTSPRWVPQMANTDAVFAALAGRAHEALHTALVPNMKGLEAAIAAGCKEVTVLSAASEAFCRANLNCSVEESLQRVREIAAHARPAGIALRAAVSTVVDCPFTGAVAPDKVAAVVGALHELGCREISLGDTTGAGTPGSVRTMLAACLDVVPTRALAGHFHDTFGMGVANVYQALEQGIRVFDSSVSGLGGCPYSPGATGNVATEDLVYLFAGLGLDSGVDPDRLLEAGDYIDGALERRTESRVGRALRARAKRALEQQPKAVC